MLSLPEWFKDPKVLALISVALNAAFAAIIAIIASDKNIQIETPYFTLSKVGLNGQVEALFAKRTDLPQVRALLEEKHFYEISPDNPGAEPIAQALIHLADSHFAHALVARLRDMSRDAKGPFKGAEQQAKIVAKKDRDGASEGIAQVCSNSGFEDMYLTIWAKDGRRGGMTVHAATERECPPSARDFVELHEQDWNRVFGRAGGPLEELVLVRLHPPRITLPPPAHPQIAQASTLRR